MWRKKKTFEILDFFFYIQLLKYLVAENTTLGHEVGKCANVLHSLIG